VAFPTLISWLYDQRYDQYAGLGWPLMLTSALLLAEAPPRASMLARAVPQLVRHYSWAQALIAGVFALAILFAGTRFGIEAVAWVLCSYAGARYLTTIGFATLQLPNHCIPASSAEASSVIRPTISEPQ
jgi:hypothetical protein